MKAFFKKTVGSFVIAATFAPHLSASRQAEYKDYADHALGRMTNGTNMNQLNAQGLGEELQRTEQDILRLRRILDFRTGDNHIDDRQNREVSDLRRFERNRETLPLMNLFYKGSAFALSFLLFYFFVQQISSQFQR